MSAALPARAFIVAGTHSGVGKTTVTLALLRGLAARGLVVQPFKIGPDFIDPGYHREVAGRTSMNLDFWMMGAENIRRTFDRFAATADVAIVESMGAIFDGEGGTDRGSAAHLARELGIPVVLVIDIWGMTRSAGALLDGFLSFDPRVTIAGFIMNRAGSDRHAEMVLDALPERLRALSLGYVLHRDALTIPERHLGLLTVEENSEAPARLALLDAAASTLALDRLAPTAPAAPRAPTSPPSARPGGRSPRIAIARDAAFCFYYAENLELLEDAGAELCPFRPTAGTLPPDIDGVYLGGGYPESFAAALAKNHALADALRRRSGEGMPIYAECGGFMYLGRSLTTFDGVSHAMTGILPVDTVMDPKHLAIRYVAVRTLTDTVLGPAGTAARGQEFHQSRLVAPEPMTPLYDVTTSEGKRYEDGLLRGSVAASYVHLHFASNREIPRHFVQSCRAYREAKKRRHNRRFHEGADLGE